MGDYSLAHLGDSDLLLNGRAEVTREHGQVTTVLLHIAEIDSRQVYRQAGYSSMHAFCVGEWNYSDDEAYVRILVARAGRRFPAMFSALEQERLHLTAARLIAPHFTPDNVEELIAASARRRTVDIDKFLAQRFPSSRVPSPAPALIRAIPTQSVGLVLKQAVPAAPLLEPEKVPAQAAPEPPPSAPPPPQRYLVKLEIDQETHDLLRQAQALLGHSVPSGDVSQVIRRALGCYVARLERKRFGSKTPRRARPSRNQRHVPVHVRHAVTERDGGQCTFVSDGGRRCASRKLLEFDHIEPVARGGKTTVDNMRLRCQAHNQLEAERVFGAEFMRRKRAEARGP